jgi:insulysin
MSLQVDQWHQHNLHQSLANKESCYNKFMCGNKESLDKEGIREILLEYHKKWYSSNIMCVTMSS